MFKRVLLVCAFILVIAFAATYKPSSLVDVQPVSPASEDQGQTLAVSQEPSFGATIPTVVSLFETSLQSSITDSSNSMTLVSGTDRAGSTLSGYMCFTIDEGTSVAEFVCGTASGTSVTGLTRGISPVTGTSTVTSLKYSHRRGASVKITNYPQLAIVSRVLNGTETLPNPLQYDSTISTTTLSGSSSYLASVGYVNGVALQGAPTATTTVAGIVQVATTAQVEGGTGITGAYTLVPSAALFSNTFRAATTVPVTAATGKLSQNFLDLTAAWAFAGNLTSNATTTILATTTKPLVLDGVSYVFPTSQGSASTTLINNGSGVLSWGAAGPAFGSWASANMDGAGHQVTADTFVIVFWNGGSAGATVNIYSDGNATPTTLRANFGATSANQNSTLIVPVRKNDYYKITTSGSGVSFTGYLLPVQ